MTTIRDVAKRAGVSVSAVSRALNDYHDIKPETKERILQVVRELNYYPTASAKQLVTKRSHTIGVFYPQSEGPGLKHPYIASVLEEFKTKAGSCGYDLMLFANTKAPFDEANMLTRVKHRDVDGVLLIGNPGQDVESLLAASLPVVGVDYTVTGTRVGSVTSDNRRALHELVVHLQRSGYGSFGYIPGEMDVSVAVERLQGFYSGMSEAGLTVRPEWIVQGAFTFDGGKKAAEELLRLKELPEVVLCGADVTAIGLMKVFTRQGIRIPEDVSIVGFDDIEAASYVTPTLTTIRQDTKAMGNLAAETLVRLIENERVNTPQHFVLPTELVVRHSTRGLAAKTLVGRS